MLLKTWINAMMICQMTELQYVQKKNCQRKNTTTYPLEEKLRCAKVVCTHQAGRTWSHSWPQDPPRCWLLPPHCSGSPGPDWGSAGTGSSRRLCGWCGTCSRSPSTKSAVTKTEWRLSLCYEGVVTTFGPVAPPGLWLVNTVGFVLHLWDRKTCFTG